MPSETQRILCKNLAPWEVSFQRKTTLGDVVMPPNAKAFFDKEEIVSQVYGSNRLFVGTDGTGSHAQIYIENDDLRKELNFDTEEKKQAVLDEEKLKKIFEYKTQAAFERAIVEAVVVHYEKFRLIEYIKKAKINDYQKIRFCEDYVGTRIE